MREKLTDFEFQVLEMLAGRRDMPWGAAVSVALEHLSSLGLATATLPYRITPAGREALNGGNDE